MCVDVLLKKNCIGIFYFLTNFTFEQIFTFTTFLVDLIAIEKWWMEKKKESRQATVHGDLICVTRFKILNRNELLESALPRRQRTSEVPDWGKFGHQQVICTGYCNGNGDGNVLRRIGYPTDGDNNRSNALVRGS